MSKDKEITEPDSQITLMLELLERDFKIVMTNTLKGLVEKGGQLAETDGDFQQRCGNYKKVKWKY